MNNPDNNKWLDKELSNIIGSEHIKPDFEQWKQKHPKAIETLGSIVNKQTKSQYHFKTIKKFPLIKLAAAIIIIIGLLTFLFFSMNNQVPKQNPDTHKFVSIKNNDDTEPTYSETQVEEGLILARQYFENNDIKGLSQLLMNYPKPVQIKAAEYLDQIGDESVLPQLLVLASRWDGLEEENIFSLAITNIEKRISESTKVTKHKSSDAVNQNIKETTSEVTTTSYDLNPGTTEETKAVFKDVIKILDNMHHPSTGKGTAVTHFSGTSVSKSDKLIEFVFKDDLYKAALYDTVINGRYRSKNIFINGKDSNFLIGTDSVEQNVRILTVQEPLFHLRIGYAFNPSTFMSYENLSIKEYLQELLNGQSTLTTDVDSMGYLHLISHYEDEEYKIHKDITLDPAKGYRLCRLNSSNEYFGDPQQKTTEQLEIQWKQYQSYWYITNASLSSSNESKLPEGMEKDKLISNENINVEIQEFSPNIEIDDSEFTVEGLDLPEDKQQFELLSPSWTNSEN